MSLAEGDETHRLSICVKSLLSCMSLVKCDEIHPLNEQVVEDVCCISLSKCGETHQRSVRPIVINSCISLSKCGETHPMGEHTLCLSDLSSGYALNLRLYNQPIYLFPYIGNYSILNVGAGIADIDTVSPDTMAYSPGLAISAGRVRI